MTFFWHRMTTPLTTCTRYSPAFGTYRTYSGAFDNSCTVEAIDKPLPPLAFNRLLTATFQFLSVIQLLATSKSVVKGGILTSLLPSNTWKVLSLFEDTATLVGALMTLATLNGQAPLPQLTIAISLLSLTLLPTRLSLRVPSSFASNPALLEPWLYG